ncbi:MAG: 1-acyl-sn-glycerol-3-phosphate acyltransferase [Bacteroidales bacterium]|nr:1-acyl-sn-glycerol-3-phosphate acyltransferase [Bacteroidales bacterium]MBN2820846.1 1-acyl-sn-glycerol-3-phosphate acyltransferase [Bacteroidales bacterium]
MTEKKASPVIRPNAFLYFTIGFLAGIYFRLFLRLKVDRSAIKGIKPPFFVVSGHTSWLDFLIVTIALYPRRMNYLAAYNFFRYPVLKSFLRLMGVIPKYQFTNDSKAILKTKSVIGSGGIIAIFPHGCLSNEGRPGGFAAPSTAKLLKNFKIPVVAVQINGGYLTRPRWTKRVHRGRIDTKVFRVFSTEDLYALSVDDIYLKLLNAIDFNDYQWQRKNNVTFKGRHLAEGAELVLYKCPKCNEEFTLRSKENKLFCLNCSNEAILSNKLFFEPGRQDSIVFDGFDNWYDFQKASLLMEIHEPDFKITTRTSLLWNEPGKSGYQKMGHGNLSLTRQAVTYEGVVFNNIETLHFDMKDIQMVPFAAGEYFEIANGADIRRFILNDVRMMMKWVLAIRLIRDEYYEKKMNL